MIACVESDGGEAAGTPFEGGSIWDGVTVLPCLGAECTSVVNLALAALTVSCGSRGSSPSCKYWPLTLWCPCVCTVSATGELTLLDWVIVFHSEEWAWESCGDRVRLVIVGLFGTPCNEPYDG